MTFRNGLELAKITLALAVATAVLVASYVGYRHFIRDYEVTIEKDGRATAQVVAATLFSRSDLRVSRLGGVVQGTARASRLWGWLKSNQVVKAPFTVDYFVPLRGLKLSDFRYDEGRKVLFVQVPDVVPDRPNVDLANTSLSEVNGLIVTRNAQIEMAKKAAASARDVSGAESRKPEHIRKSREYARSAIEQLFEGALSAARVDARVEVRFAGEPGLSREEWDVTRSVADVLAEYFPEKGKR